ncbi:MAG: beta-lactamase family protein [Anaerolineaceae bacterium]|nr:beta-lactamase family protein [Anaerolineaceae bacterium]
MASTDIKNTLKKLDNRVIEFINKHALSGMAVGVVQDGKLVYGKGFGLAEAESKKPVTTDTVFRIASISKTFTAIGIMQLWEKGKFKLDDPVNDYLKDYQVLHPDPHAPPVTFRHMLTHTSGIGEMRDMSDLLKGFVKPSSFSYKPNKPLPALEDYYNGLLVPDVHPDKKWAYANNAYATLGQVIEDVSGQPFAEYMIEHVFEPLGMNKTDFDLSERVEAELAQGYTLKKGFLDVVEYSIFPGRAAGSAMSSVQDMALYLAALMNGARNEHGSVLKAKTIEKMMTPHYREDPHLAAMGLCFFLEDLDGHTAAWHGGSLPGFNCSMWVAPDDKFGVLVFANSNTRAIYHLGKDILRSLIGLPDFSERLPKPDVTNSPHLWKDLVGSYQPYKGFNSNMRIWMGYGGEVEVYVRDGKLMLRSLAGPYKKGIVLYPVDAQDPLAFESVNDDKLMQLVFQRNAEGYIDHLSISTLSSLYTFYKVPKTRSLRFMIKTAAGVLAGIILGILGKSIAKKCCKK